ncbi:hypothetical protein D9M68_813590 [compost metagenome]
MLIQGENFCHGILPHCSAEAVFQRSRINLLQGIEFCFELIVCLDFGIKPFIALLLFEVGDVADSSHIRFVFMKIIVKLNFAQISFRTEVVYTVGCVF